MKNIILAVTVALAIFASTGAFARGFSVGVLGSYAIDNGAIDDWADHYIKEIPNIVQPNDVYKYESPEIAGIVSFLRYDFNNNLFIRSGFETNFIINGGTYHKGIDVGSPTANYNDNKIKYTSYTIPFYLGITLSPDKGKTSVYSGAGIYYSIIEMQRKEYVEAHGADLNQNYGKTNMDTNNFGLSGIIGLERKLLLDISIIIEYAVYSSKKKIERLEREWTYYINGVYSGTTSEDVSGFTDNPRQQIRAGLKYNF